MLDQAVLMDSINRLVTSDYRGKEDKINAIKQFLTPIIKTMLLAESYSPAGTKASMEVKNTINLLIHHNLIDVTTLER